MEKLEFKTNIKCAGCIETVTPYLNQLPGLEKWEVNTQVPEKVLSVTGSLPDLQEQVIQVLKKAGYEAKPI